ncbi:MAG: hypothetical protein MRERV_28c005 [Mycoplasmataceae bacterium RV_VA103A]|nr:MAG: hypothetical protein MRERV_28c005 [Mycoplasmataceae bacterium RV_VA103A]
MTFCFSLVKYLHQKKISLLAIKKTGGSSFKNFFFCVYFNTSRLCRSFNCKNFGRFGEQKPQLCFII